MSECERNYLIQSGFAPVCLCVCERESARASERERARERERERDMIRNGIPIVYFRMCKHLCTWAREGCVCADDMCAGTCVCGVCVCTCARAHTPHTHTALHIRACVYALHTYTALLSRERARSHSAAQAWWHVHMVCTRTSTCKC